MSNEIDWSKAPEGATHYYPHDNYPWRKVDGPFVYGYFEGEWIRQRGSPQFNLYYTRLDMWTGQGLPPVGTVCECQNDAFKWLQGVIVHTGNDRGKKIAIMQCENEMLWGEAGEFRPIRTKAQIEAEERERVVKQMIEDSRPMNRRAVCEDLYDAGYRKTESGK